LLGQLPAARERMHQRPGHQNGWLLGDQCPTKSVKLQPDKVNIYLKRTTHFVSVWVYEIYVCIKCCIKTLLPPSVFLDLCGVLPTLGRVWLSRGVITLNKRTWPFR
jgi:hypothetical protein